MTLLLYLMVLSLLPEIIKNGFYPSFSSLTFPMMISAIAVMRSYEYLTGEGNIVELLRNIGVVMELIAAAVVLGVLGLYIINYVKPQTSVGLLP